MATPRVTIDQLPIQATPEDTNELIIQDVGVTKRLTVAALRAMPSQALTDHINDTDGAHAASAVSATSSGTGVDGTNVQTQLGQLATLVDGKISQTVADGLYVNIGGDTMTAPLVLPGPPANPLEAATKDYVDSKVIEAGGGITQPEADARYVNLDGDTMTGALVVDQLISTGTGVQLPAGEPSAADRAATKQYVDDLIAATKLAMWPVGSIYIGTTPANPGTFIGGTWASFGAGRTLFGLNAADASFDTVEETGGAKTVTLAEANLPAHDHSMAHTHEHVHTHPINHDHPSVTTDNPGHHTHAAGGTGSHFLELVGTGGTYARAAGTGTIAYSTTGSEGGHTHTVNLPSFTGTSGAASDATTGGSSAANTGMAGSGTAIDKLPPYIVTYMWKRTA